MSRINVLLVYHNLLLTHLTDMYASAVYKASGFQITQSSTKSPQGHMLPYMNKWHYMGLQTDINPCDLIINITQKRAKKKKILKLCPQKKAQFKG